jgi:hypothetical protein
LGSTCALDDQGLILRDDVQDGITGAQDTTDRMDLHPHHGTALRRPDHGSLQGFFECADTLAQVEQIRLHRMQLLYDLAHETPLHLDDLQLGFADLDAGRRDRGLVIGTLALQLGGQSLPLTQPALVAQPSLEQFVESGDLFLIELEALALTLRQCFQPADLLLQLTGALFEHLDLAAQRLMACLEDTSLARDGFLDPRVVLHFEQIRGKGDGFIAVTLGDQTRLLGALGQELTANDLQLRPRLGVIEPHQHAPLLHPVALAHQDLTDDPALEMLNGLARTLHSDHTGRHGRAVDGSKRRPQQKAAQPDQQDQESKQALRPVTGAQLRHFGERNRRF